MTGWEESLGEFGPGESERVAFFVAGTDGGGFDKRREDERRVERRRNRSK
jgi:hypothetical protein